MTTNEESAACLTSPRALSSVVSIKNFSYLKAHSQHIASISFSFSKNPGNVGRNSK